MVTNSVSQTNLLVRSHHKMVGITSANRMSEPPIVGVPAFFLCVCGPSVRICSPICLLRSRSMNQGPSRNEIASAVSVAAMMRVET